MNDELTQQLVATADRLANAAATLDRVLGKLDAQQEALNAKVDRIVAAVEDRGEAVDSLAASSRSEQFDARIAELEKANRELTAQAARAVRKTLPPLVSSLLAKAGSEPGERMEAGVLDKTLQSLTVDQRIAVKAEMARAGMIE